MRVGVFGDLHANIHATRAVLAALESERTDRLVCLGDLVGYGAHPDEVVAEIRHTGMPCILGNYDDGVGFDRPDCGCAYRDERDRQLGHASLAWTKSHASEKSRSFLRGLPARYEISLRDLRILFVHGSPRRINEYLFADRPDKSLARMMDEAGADVLICGHTHIPYVHAVEGRLIVNPGSAGRPRHGRPLATYAILSVDEDGPRAEIREVPYPAADAARAVLEAGLPDEFAEVLLTGRG